MLCGRKKSRPPTKTTGVPRPIPKQGIVANRMTPESQNSSSNSSPPFDLRAEKDEPS